MSDPTGVNGYIIGDVGVYIFIGVVLLFAYAIYNAPSNEELLAAQNQNQNISHDVSHK